MAASREARRFLFEMDQSGLRIWMDVLGCLSLNCMSKVNGSCKRVLQMGIPGMKARRLCCWHGVLGCVVWLAVLLGSVVGSVSALADRREDPLGELSRDERAIFQNYTRLYCQQFFRFDRDRFVLLPNYQRSRENSTGRSYEQALEEMTEIEVVKIKGATREIKHPPPAAEVIVSARVIPAIDVGHYGFVNSVMVKEVVGPGEMIVSGIELIPKSEVGTANNALRKAAADRQKQYATKTYRMLGFNTEQLKAGDKYQGPQNKGLQVAVMSTDPQHAFVLVNYERLERVRTHEFPEVLAYVQIEPRAFIDMVRENREQLSTEGDKASLITIYRRFYNRYRPKRLSSITRLEIQEPQAAPEVTPEVTAKPEPEPEPEVKPEPKPEPKPRFEAEPEADDWDSETDTDKAPDKPTFFGIPL